MSLLLSVISWGMGDMAYIDALFFATGACTQSGLNTVDVDRIHTGQQVCYYLGAMMCNPIVIHSTVVFVRLYWFEKRFKDVVAEARALRRSRSRSRTMDRHDTEQGRREMGRLSPDQNIRFLQQQRNESDSGVLHIPSPREFEMGSRPANVEDVAGLGKVRRTSTSRTNPELEPINTDGARTRTRITINEPEVPRDRDKTWHLPRADSGMRTLTRDREEPGIRSQSRRRRPSMSSNFRRTTTGVSIEAAPYLSYQPTVGRNSFFVNLTQAQRDELGGIEYRSLKTLAWILVLYFFCFHALGFVSLSSWIMNSGTYGKVVTDQAQDRVWWGFFTAASMFNDLGLTLTNNSMMGFQLAVFPLLLGSFLIIIGNTGFPSSATWWLFGILVVLNGVDLIFFIILDLHDPVVTSMPPGIRLVDGLFQAAATRTAGFAVVNIAQLHPAIQVSYLIMMYISVFPIAISMRRTNVYEEKSLGIYATATEQDGDDEQEPSYVSAHLRRQLSFDLWYLFLGLFIIAIVEGSRLEDQHDPSFSLFSVLFEIVSAYGTVGLSLGYPTINASLSAEFKVLSKLVIIAMQVRGRHRGLPYQLDRAVLLPSEEQEAKEAQEAQRILLRRRSSVSTMLSARSQSAENHSFRFRPETGLSSGFEPQNQTGNDGQHTKQEVGERDRSHRFSNMRLKFLNSKNTHEV
ncbi:hypothetical protein DV735_g1474, partial [Chaetothyriales sp. CBS 134920]